MSKSGEINKTDQNFFASFFIEMLCFIDLIAPIRNPEMNPIIKRTELKKNFEFLFFAFAYSLLELLTSFGKFGFKFNRFLQFFSF